MRRNKKKNLIPILIVLLLGISLGYALLSQDLTILGTSKVKGNTWDIHFENVVINSNSVALSTGDVAAAIDSNTLTDITYTVTLKEPGDFYEFEVAIVNSGTLNAMIGMITNKLNGTEIGTGNPLPTYLSYTVTYSDSMPLTVNQILEAGHSETIKVRLAFRTDIDPEDLPTSGATHTLSFGLSYVQADDNAVAVPHPVSFSTDSWETIIAAVQAGVTSSYSVGDTKSIALGNGLGTHTLRIANMLTPSECSTTGFSQTACGFVLEFADAITSNRMNPAGEYQGNTYNYGWNVDGWPVSAMRTYLNDISKPTSVINSLPTVIKNAIIDTFVVSGHGSTSGETNFTSTDKLYLLSTHEVLEDDDGSITIGPDYYDTAYNSTRQLDYYAGINVTSSNASGASKLYYDSTSNWWLRSANSRDKICFCYVTNLGSLNTNTARSVREVSPAFRLG